MTNPFAGLVAGAEASDAGKELKSSNLPATDPVISDDPELGGSTEYDSASELDDVIKALTERGLRLPSSDIGQTEIVQRKPIAAFKNREISRFAFAGFEFRDHMLYIYTAADYARFVEALNELPPIEAGYIVSINLEALAALESPVKPVAVRGVTATANIIDPRAVK